MENVKSDNNLMLTFDDDIDLNILEQALNSSTITNVEIKIKMNAKRKRVVLLQKDEIALARQTNKPPVSASYVDDIKEFMKKSNAVMNRNELASYMSSKYNITQATAGVYISLLIRMNVLKTVAKKTVGLVEK